MFLLVAGQMYADEYIRYGGLNYTTYECPTGEVRVQYEKCNFDKIEPNYPNLKEATIPTSIVYNGVPYRVTRIMFHAFNDCYSLKRVSIPNSIRKIESYAFARCRALISVTIEEGLQIIDVNGFLECESLDSIHIPNSVIRIEVRAFQGCRSLSSISLGNGLKYIGTEAFNECIRLTKITIPSNVTEIGDWAFMNCSSLQVVRIQTTPSMIKIGYNAFPSTTKVIFSDGTTMIGGVVQKKQSSTQTTQKQNLNKQTPSSNTKKGLTKD